MLGDDVPWLVPFFAISLITWQMTPIIEKKALEKGKWLKSLHNLLPLIFLSLIILDRLIAVLTNDLGHSDIAKYNAGANAMNGGPWMTFLRGDGLSELSLMVLLIFSLSVDKLPSISQSPQFIRTLVRHRVMCFVSLVALFSFTVFFPDSSYLNAQSITSQSTWPTDSIGPLWYALLTIAILIIAAELFATSTIAAVDSGLSNLAKKAKYKLVVIFTIAVFLFMKIDVIKNMEADVWLDLEHYYHLIFISIFLHMAISFATILEPAKQLDSKLGAGDGRTKSLIFTSLLAFIFLIIISLMFSQSLDIFSGNGESLMTIWLLFAVIVTCVGSMFLPTMGFDATPRPELWWVRLTLSLSPLFIAAFSPYILILLPAIWFSLAVTLVIPWLVEEDVRNLNSKQLYISIALVIIFALTIVPRILQQPGNQLFLIWLCMPLIPLLLSSVLLHQMRKQQQLSA
ncbi:MAG: hypothetical protein O3B00_01205 [archaeon]|nr:hypothetical protein [archaeon]MDA1130102.1 hypothetical protein [archaeon]